MKIYSEAISQFESASEKQPHFVYEQVWNLAEIANTYFTSSVDAQTPGGADVIASSFVDVSGQTQKINPDIATSEIGSLTVQLLDIGSAITTKINDNLIIGDGLRGKIGRLYVGYEGMAFADYDLRVTYIVDSITYRDGLYKISLSDIQRSTRQKIFSPKETNLNTSVSDTDLFIPVTTSDLTLFPTFEHGAEYSTRPGETVGYAKLDKEVFCYSAMATDGVLGPGFVVLKRGVLGTRAVEHAVDSTTETNRRPKIVEHIYIEGAAPKVIYALLTGKVEGQTGDMPDHWHLSIPTGFVKLTDFQSLGVDYWNPANDTGRFVRIENPEVQDGKRYIEKEMLLWLGAFMPVYPDGSIGIKRLTKILSDSSYSIYLNASNIKSYSDLTHDMQSVINDIEIEWNYVDAKEDFTKTSRLIDAVSIAQHKISDVKKFAFKSVNTGLHTDEDLLAYFDTLRDRYSGPPLRISVEVLPTMSMVEVGDVVKLQLDQVRDFAAGGVLNRAFEVQQVATNWMTGAIRLTLFGSSQKAGELSRTTLSSVLNDAYYTQIGTDLASILTISAGVVTANYTLTGHATDVDNASAIYYYDGDLTIGPGVTITITENVQLRIKGSLQVNGTIDGIATGPSGGAVTTHFVNGTTSYAYVGGFGAAPVSQFDLHPGDGGYFGTTITPANIFIFGAGVAFWIDNTPREHVGVSSVAFQQLSNKNALNSLTGYFSDLRGSSGISGYPILWTKFSPYIAEIVANGGAGGDGGAGLLIVARGMAFGGSGKIDLSGGDSTYGASYALPGGTIFYGAAGAPGAPGALLILMDGNATNPDINESNFIANFGDAPVPAGAVEFGKDEASTLTYNPINISNKAPYGATENISATASAHRIIYIPPDETVQAENDPQPADVTGFTVSQNGGVVVFRWNRNADVLLAGFEIRYGPRGAISFANATPLTQVTKGTAITSGDIPPGDYTFYCAAVNNSVVRNYSENPATADLVVTSVLDIIVQQQQAPDWSGTLTNFVKHHTGVLVPASQEANSNDGATVWANDTIFSEFVHNPFSSCTYEAPEIDIDFDDPVRVWGSIDSALGPGETEGIADPKLSIDYRLDAGSYDGFADWSIGDLTLRYIKCKLTLDTTKGIVKVTSFKPTVDVLEHTLTATGVTISPGGSTITFSQPFHNPPFVRVFLDAASSLTVTRTNVTATGFDCNVFNSTGTAVGGTVDWEALGA